MSAPSTPLAGDELLAAVTEEMIALHRRYHHRAPVTAKTQLLGGDLLACVLGGVKRSRLVSSSPPPSLAQAATASGLSMKSSISMSGPTWWLEMKSSTSRPDSRSTAAMNLCAMAF